MEGASPNASDTLGRKQDIFGRAVVRRLRSGGGRAARNLEAMHANGASRDSQ